MKGFVKAKSTQFGRNSPVGALSCTLCGDFLILYTQTYYRCTVDSIFKYALLRSDIQLLDIHFRLFKVKYLFNKIRNQYFRHLLFS